MPTTAPFLAIPLWPLTVITELTITVILIFYLVYGCYTIDELECTLENPPMISDILQYHIYDRVFVFIMTFHSVFVFFGNIRAFYTRFAGIFSDGTNSLLYWMGIVATICPPMIGIFDESLNVIHLAFAITFFAISGLYIVIFICAVLAVDKPGVLTPDEEAAVVYLKYLRAILIIVAVVGVGAALIHGNRGLTAYAEWLGTIILIDSFSIMSRLDHESEVVMPQSQLKAN